MNHRVQTSEMSLETMADVVLARDAVQAHLEDLRDPLVEKLTDAIEIIVCYEEAISLDVNEAYTVRRALWKALEQQHEDSLIYAYAVHRLDVDVDYTPPETMHLPVDSRLDGVNDFSNLDVFCTQEFEILPSPES